MSTSDYPQEGRAGILAEPFSRLRFILAPAAAVIVICSLLFRQFCIRPARLYEDAEAAFASGNYAEAGQQFAQLGSYRDSARLSALAARADAYLRGKEALEQEAFSDAVSLLTQAGDHEDAPTLLALAQGMAALEAEQYAQAAEALAQAGAAADPAALAYAQGRTSLAGKDYSAARAAFAQAEGFADSETLLAQAEQAMHLQEADRLFRDGQYLEALGEYLLAGDLQQLVPCLRGAIGQGQAEAALELCAGLEAPDEEAGLWLRYLKAAALAGQNKYEKAIPQLEQLQELPEAAALLEDSLHSYTAQLEQKGSYAKAIPYYEMLGAKPEKLDELRFLQAESEYAKGNLNTARSFYEALPKGYTHSGIAAADRLEILEKNSRFAALCGKWRASSGKIETKQTYVLSNSSYFWYDTYTNAPAYVDLHCIIGEDGRVTVCGDVDYIRFTNYSDYTYNLKRETVTEHFSLVTPTVPYALLKTDTASLTFNLDTLKLTFRQVVRDPEVYYYFTYTSNFTYSNLVNAY